MEELALHSVRQGELDHLISLLRADHHTVIGPTLRDGVIVLDELSSVADLPVGYGDRHSAGRYQVEKRAGDCSFDYVLGPHSWKRYLFPPKIRLFEATREGNGDGPF